MEGKNVVQNKAPQVRVGAPTQGKSGSGTNTKDNTSPGARARYEKGLELYREGKVSIGANGYFKVSGYLVDPEKIACSCPDYATRKQPCKHYYAVSAFQKGKPLSENGKIAETGNPQESHKTPSNKPQEAHSKDFDRQRVITRLAVLNTAVEILRSHNKPITSKNLFKVARELETFALGGE